MALGEESSRPLAQRVAAAHIAWRMQRVRVAGVPHVVCKWTVRFIRRNPSLRAVDQPWPLAPCCPSPPEIVSLQVDKGVALVDIVRELHP